MNENSNNCCCGPAGCNTELSSQGVLYFLRDDTHIQRFTVSIFSLRRHYLGPVTLVAEGSVAGALEFICKKFSVDLIALDDTSLPLYAAKVAALLHTPYDFTVFLDADTLVIGSIKILFKTIQLQDFVFTKHNDHGCVTGTGSDRLNCWAGKGLISDDQIAKAKTFPFINIGVFAFRKNHPFLTQWLQLARKGEEIGLGISDEVVAQLFLPNLDHKILDQRYNWSGYFSELHNAVIIHYLNGTHEARVEGHNLTKYYQTALEELSISYPELFSELWQIPDMVPDVGNDIPNTPAKQLIYTIAFDAPNSVAFKTMARLCVSSILRVGFEGTILIFHNTPGNVFPLARHGVKEIFLDTFAYFGEEREKIAVAMKYLAAAYIDETQFETISYIDCDCLALAPLDKMLSVRNHIAYAEERLPISHSYFNAYLTVEEMSTLDRGGINSGVFVVPASKYRLLMRKWESVSKMAPLRESKCADQPAWNRVIIDEAEAAKPLESELVRYPAFYDSDIFSWDKATLLHFCGPEMTTSKKVALMFGVWMQSFYGDAPHVIVECLNI